MSGLMFADDFVGIPEIPEGLQKQRQQQRTLRNEELQRKSKKCAVVVCNEDKVNPAIFKWMWGEDELPIADQYTYLGVENALGMYTQRK